MTVVVLAFAGMTGAAFKASPSSATPATLSWTNATADPDVGEPTAISCASANFCVAVDTEGKAITYNGTSWSAASIDAPRQITSVSCPTSTFCMAVDGAGLALTWNGTVWSSPASTGYDYGINEVSCPTSTFCAATVIGGSRVLFWDGSWSQSQPGLAVTSISCVSATFCVAIGGPYAVTFTGAAWSAPVTVNTPSSQLYSVSCVSTTLCVTVATDFAHPSQSFTYNGATWSGATSIGFPYVTKISCAATIGCVASTSLDGSTLAYNGTTWSSRIDLGDQPRGLSCRPTFCEAISRSGNSYRFDGASWTQGAVADFTAGAPDSVSCPSDAFCVAGDAFGNVLTFNGTQWSAPTRVAVAGQPVVVSCSSTTHCVMIAGTETHVFNGASWSAGSVVSGMFTPSSLSCPTATRCVGVYNNEAEVYDGSGWIVDPNAFPSGTFVDSVSCVTNTFCMAVSGDGRAFRFDGSTWSSATSVQSSSSNWSSVSCVSVMRCVATFGDFVGPTGGVWSTFNGTTWSAPAPIRPSAVGATLVSCATASFCVAVPYLQSTSPVSAYSFDGSNWSAPSTAFAQGTTLALDCPSTHECVTLDVSGESAIASATAPGAPTGVIATDGDTTAFVSWTAPTDSGSSPVIGYDVQYSTNGGTTWADVPNVSHTSTAPSLTVSGLANGLTYLFRVAAISDIDTGVFSTPSNPVTPMAAGTNPPTPGTPTPTPTPTGTGTPGSPSALADSTNQTITVGRSVSVSTTLTSNGQAVSGATVLLQARHSGDTSWTQIRSLTTSATGTVSTSVRPSMNTEYEWTYAGDASHAAAQSDGFGIDVHQAVSVHATRRQVRSGHSVTLYGVVAPSTSTGVVYLQQFRHGRWTSTGRSVGIGYLEFPDGSEGFGYAFNIRLGSKGTVLIRMHRRADPDNLGGSSPALSLVVH